MKTIVAIVALVLVSILGYRTPQPTAIHWVQTVGVIWSDNGHTLDVEYRVGMDYFIRQWDFTQDGEEMEVFQMDGPSGYPNEAFAVGVTAKILPNGLVEVLKQGPQGIWFGRNVYGHVV